MGKKVRFSILLAHEQVTTTAAGIDENFRTLFITTFPADLRSSGTSFGRHFNIVATWIMRLTVQTNCAEQSF